MRDADLTALFEPRGVAVVGASTNPGKLGHAMADSLSTYSGDLRLINSRPAPGMFASIAEAADGADLDLAVMCVPAAFTADALRESADVGIRAALVCAGGFAEAGGIGLDYARAIDAAVQETGIRVLGRNTSGFFVPSSSLFASFVPGVRDFGPGAVAVVAASGGVNHVLSFLLQEHGDGVSFGVGVGAGQDVATPDVLQYLVGHAATTAVILHVETVPDGVALLDAVRDLSAVKPVVALVIGRSDVSEFASSHTGALTTSWRVARAALRQAGAVIADDEEHAVAAALALAAGRGDAAAAPGIGLITGQAGPGLIIADRLTDGGDSLPRLATKTQNALSEFLPPLTFQKNPVDTGRPSPEFGGVVAAVATDPAIDVLGIYAITEPVVDLGAAVKASGVLGRLPILLGVDGPAEAVSSARASAKAAGLGILRGPTRLAQGLAAIAEDARSARLKTDPGATPHVDPLPDLSAGSGWDEVRAKDLLDALGIATPPRRRCVDRDEARRAFHDLPGAVAVKLVDANVLHKTELGGVVLGVDSERMLERALDHLERAGAREFLVEAMAPSGLDLIVGARHDVAFGPVVMLGVGGLAAEVVADVAIRTAPLGERVGSSMIDDLATASLLRGFRGGPVADEIALGRLVARLGDLVVRGLVAEIEINPLRLTDSGMMALDAVVLPVDRK
ncbi:MAG: acyl-CoA synthetase [Microbacterium sp.]|jgi:acetyltransferase|nr:acyl-CoA synthetase [Microbacterium sp.]